MARKTQKKALSEETRKYRLALAQAEVDLALSRVHEAEEDVREAQERVVEETDLYEHAKAVYADILSGRSD